jgi:hypothetical protein
MKRFIAMLSTAFLASAILILAACTQSSDTANNQTSKSANSATTPSTTAAPNASATPSNPAPNSSTGAIKIGSRPAGASVMLIADEGGEAGKPQLRGASPTTISDLTPGKYTVHLELKGYKYFQKAVEVKAGETVSVTAELQK